MFTLQFYKCDAQSNKNVEKVCSMNSETSHVHHYNKSSEAMTQQ